ncbi:hypothetical protein [Schlesneria sp. T3-172]|uniref:hypothetical protein n=1 Tax=Schlesneria sphaerica TaxID=3373610 RepID=UPI0037C7CA47
MTLRFSQLRIYFAALFSLSIGFVNFASAADTRIPLVGCRGHFAASGSARYVTFRNEARRPDQEITTIEVTNVPLPPGTVLAVFVTGTQIGTIKLDGNQSGSLVLNSKKKDVPPPIEAGTTVNIRTLDGKLVMW